jgi:hypothetical protein
LKHSSADLNSVSLEKIYTSFTAFVSNCANTFISFLKVMLLSRLNVRLPQSTGHTCILLGNGPSLNQSLQKHRDFFRRHTLICVNRFCLSEEYTLLKPAYCVMLDPGFWLNEEDEGIKRTLTLLIERTTWDLQLLLPQNAKGSAFIKKIEKHNPRIIISYFNYTVFKGFTGIAHYAYKKNWGMPQSQNVMVAAIFLAINMHFKTIYIVGADHSWHQDLYVNDQNQLCIKDVHFYANQQNGTPRLFHKDAQHRETFTMYEVFQAFGKAFYGYQLLRAYADFCNATIYNASEVSFIDAFERKQIDDNQDLS